MVQYVHYPIYGTANPNIIAAGTSLIFKAPSDANGGGITIHEAYMNVRSGTVTMTLVDMGAAGTAIAGTIATLVGAVAAAGGGTVNSAPNGYWIDGGNHVGVVYGVGTIVPPGGIYIGYRMGR